MKQSDLEIFEAQRSKLFSLAYRMLGEVCAAEDIVQDAWITWNGSNRSTIELPAAWLYQVTNRLAIDALRSARVRRESYFGPWLPEPLLDNATPSAEDKFAHARECELALLWAMEKLSPEERSAFIMREVFDSDYSEVAEALGKTSSTCRKLVSRAKQKLKSHKGIIETKASANDEMLLRFAQACQSQDHQEMLGILAPDVVAISDGGGKARAASRPLIGAQEVARVLLAFSSKPSLDAIVNIISINGHAAIQVTGTESDNILSTVRVNANGLIEWVYMMRNPEKLPRH